tara:strand:+ start:224 stop:442 length:219 start_codon:yes stop_codon:yes gene_type:complete
MDPAGFNLNYLSPTGIIGFWILFIGLIFTGIMFNFVFLKIYEEEGTYQPKERTKKQKEEQRLRIARLYPKRN